MFSLKFRLVLVRRLGPGPFSLPQSVHHLQAWIQREVLDRSSSCAEFRAQVDPLGGVSPGQWPSPLGRPIPWHSPPAAAVLHICCCLPVLGLSVETSEFDSTYCVCVRRSEPLSHIKSRLREKVLRSFSHCSPHALQPFLQILPGSRSPTLVFLVFLTLLYSVCGRQILKKLFSTAYHPTIFLDARFSLFLLTLRSGIHAQQSCMLVHQVRVYPLSRGGSELRLLFSILNEVSEQALNSSDIYSPKVKYQVTKV